MSETRLSSSVSARPVVVIDDDDAVRDSLMILLEAHGFSVVCFGSSETYLAASSAAAFAVLADNNLPGMSGIELLQQLAGRGVPPRLGLISGRMNSAVRDRAQALGAAAFHKPASIEALLDWLK